MKQLLRSISCMLSMILAITGCGQNGGQSKVTKGCYVEKVVEWDQEKGTMGMGKTGDGKIILAQYDEEQECAIIYSLKEDGTWEESNKVSLPLGAIGDKNIVSSSITEDSIMFLQISEEDGSSQISELLADGTQNVIELKEEGKPYTLSPNEWYTFSKAENGDYIMSEGWGKSLNSFNGKDGEIKHHFINDCLSYALSGDKLICNGWQEKNISTFSIENGEIIESFEYPREGEANCIDVTDEGVYLFNSVKGISFKSKDSEEWKSVVSPDRKQLADASNGIIQAYVINDKSFFVHFGDDSMMTYTYDPEAEDVISAEVNIFMREDVALLQKAISIYQKDHKDVKINIVNYAERPVDALNAEILAGEGPDLLVLDTMPIQTYIDKGVLADLSDIASECYNKEGCYKNVIDAYKQGEGIWAIPMRFQVPMLWGKNEIINEAHSLEELAEYRESHPDEVLFKKNMVELAYQMSVFSEPFMCEGGNYSREKLTQYINLLKKIGVQEGEITNQIYGERLEVEPSKYTELLDFANGESSLFLVAPRNVGDIARADSMLDARKQEDVGVKALEINGKVPFMANGVLAINKNSKHQDIVKDIIRIALDEEVQGEVNYLGIPITETALKTQEQFLTHYEDEMKDDKGRSVTVDNDITRVYDECKTIWKEASLCCNNCTSIPYDAENIISSIYKDHLNLEQILDEYDKSREVKEKE